MKVLQIFTWKNFDTFIICNWLALFFFGTLAFIATLFPNFFTFFNQPNVLFACLAISTARFLQAFQWKAVIVMPIVYGLVVCFYWFLLYIYIFRSYPDSLWISCLVPTCIACLIWPALYYMWDAVRPEAVELTERDQYEIWRRKINSK